MSKLKVPIRDGTTTRTASGALRSWSDYDARACSTFKAAVKAGHGELDLSGEYAVAVEARRKTRKRRMSRRVPS